MIHKIIPFLVDYIVKNGHIDPKISKIIQNSEIFLPDTDEPLSGNSKTNTFFVNQKVNFGDRFGGIIPISKRIRATL